jgi:hypothetical protein
MASTDVDTTAQPESAQGLLLVGEVQEARPPGFDAPEGERSYFARAPFTDPDGNRWVLQEITTRLPGREWED